MTRDATFGEVSVAADRMLITSALHDAMTK